MTRFDYMNKLDSLLKDISPRDRDSALRYYDNYFEEAGPGNEKKVIKALGSPSKLAASIREEASRTPEPEPPSNRKRRRKSKDIEEANVVNSERFLEEPKYDAEDESAQNKKVLVFLLCLFAIPVGIPIILVILAALFGVAFALVALLVGFILGSLVFLGSGMICIFAGITLVTSGPTLAMLVVGTGLIMLGLGIFFAIFSIWLCTKVLPTFISGVITIAGRTFYRNSEMEVE